MDGAATLPWRGRVVHRDTIADMTVCVIGGGVVGLACAYELAARGAEVCVLERGRVGEGASKGNTGWITPSFSYPLAAPGVIRSGLRSALSPGGALVIRPSLDPAFLRWLWRFRARSTVSAFRDATQALMGMNAHTYETLDRWLESGVAFEQHPGRRTATRQALMCPSG